MILDKEPLSTCPRVSHWRKKDFPFSGWGNTKTANLSLSIRKDFPLYAYEPWAKDKPRLVWSNAISKWIVCVIHNEIYILLSTNEWCIVMCAPCPPYFGWSASLVTVVLFLRWWSPRTVLLAEPLLFSLCPVVPNGLLFYSEVRNWSVNHPPFHPSSDKIGSFIPLLGRHQISS